MTKVFNQDSTLGDIVATFPKAGAYNDYLAEVDKEVDWTTAPLQ